MGIEALSRGASFVVFVDASVKAVSVIKKNVSKINGSKNFSIVNKTAMNFLENNKQLFDIAFMDPPYNKNILPDLILEISKIINPGGIVICEHESSTVLPKNIKNLNVTKTKHYGTISVTFYKKSTLLH
jgi:16S rRNA (guanine(966)-N(2))-methyltransferase RsmD